MKTATGRGRGRCYGGRDARARRSRPSPPSPQRCGAGAALLAASVTRSRRLDDDGRRGRPAADAVDRRVDARLDGTFDPAALYAARAHGVVTVYANLGADGESQGSGFVVDKTGAILTNAHVITNVAELERGRRRPSAARARVYVEFTDGERVPARIVGWDLFSDVGVIRVEPDDHALAPVPLGDSARVVVGEPVAAIGSPFGKQTSLSVGVVSATGRSIDSLTSGFTVANAIQTDAPINRGNSGGPLFDGDGRVIGINAQIQSTSGTAEGVGFAIPIDIARRSLDQLVRTGRVRYAYIGIRTEDVTPGIAEAFDLGADRGALVTRVEDGTPAAQAGLRGGSRIEAHNGVDITLGGDLIVAIAGKAVAGTDDVSRIVTAARARPDGPVHGRPRRPEDGGRRDARRPSARLAVADSASRGRAARRRLEPRARSASGATRTASWPRVRGAGGLVTALRPLVDRGDVTWVASAMGDAERELRRRRPAQERSAAGTPFRLRLVAHDPEAYRLFYSVVANPVLWFVQHGLWALKHDPDADLRARGNDGYVAANRALAEAAVAELDRAPARALYVHDYHLYLVPALVRALRPDARIAFFVHIPWVGPDDWAVLPREIGRAVHEGCSRATASASTRSAGAPRSSHPARPSSAAATTQSARSHANPIAVDADEFDALAASDAVRARRAELQADRPEILVLRVDRTDPSKNAVRGFEAFGRLLERAPALHGRVASSRCSTPPGRRFPSTWTTVVATERAAAAVNRASARPDWQPVRLDVRDDFLASVAAYMEYDVLLINPVMDGLNLVAKEAPLVNDRDGVLVLSREAGAFAELAEWAIGVDPLDVDDQADALARAIALPRRRAARRLEGIGAASARTTSTRGPPRARRSSRRGRPRSRAGALRQSGGLRCGVSVGPRRRRAGARPPRPRDPRRCRPGGDHAARGARRGGREARMAQAASRGSRSAPAAGCSSASPTPSSRTTGPSPRPSSRSPASPWPRRTCMT